MTANGPTKARTKVTIRLSHIAWTKLNDLARANRGTPSSVAREAVEFYLTNIENLQNATWQSPLEQRMQKLEDRLAALLAKLSRAVAQTLYFTTLPYTKGGLPTKPLPQEAFQILWEQSRAFAADWLRKARIDETQGGDSGEQ